MALTYSPHLRSADATRRRVRQKDAPTHVPTAEELRQLIGCKVGDAIAQMRRWGYGQVTLNVPQNRVSVVTRQGRLNFQFLPQNAIVNRIEWESPRESDCLRREAGLSQEPTPLQPSWVSVKPGGPYP